MQRLRRFSSGFVDFFFIPFVLVSFLGSLTLILSNFQGLSSTGIKVVAIVFFGMMCYTVCAPIRQYMNRVFKRLLKIINEHRTAFLAGLIVVTLLWQVAVVFLVSGRSIWDPDIITKTAMRDLSSGMAPDYFSVNPNTLLLLFLEHGLWLISGRLEFENFIIFLNLVNVFLIDSAVLMVGRVAGHWFGKTSKKILLMTSWGLMVMSPWVALPYSDTWAFFVTALGLFLGDCLLRNKMISRKYLFAVSLGLLIIFGYYLKPSLVITVFAAVIVLSFIVFENAKIIFKRTVWIGLCWMLLGAGIGVTAYQITLNRQNLVTFTAGKAHPLWHFMAMGMQGNGAFYEPDVVMDTHIKSPVARKKANLKLVHERFKAFHGLTNYEKFLVQKQISNTADGSFSWGQDGTFIITNHADSARLNNTLIRRLFAKNGIVQVNNFEYRFIVQLIWCGVLFMLLFTIGVDDWKVQFLKYGMVGFMLFLLLFEGGRSRYLIQFLPLTLLLGSIGGKRLLLEVKKLSLSKNIQKF